MTRPVALVLLGLAVATLVSYCGVGLLMTADPPLQRSERATRPAATAPIATRDDPAALNAVAAALVLHPSGATRSSLRTKPNPKGEGVFVYSTVQQQVLNAKRQFLWLYIDGQAYAINGSSKDLTPSLSWPREAPDGLWARTGLDLYSATDALTIVFGR